MSNNFKKITRFLKGLQCQDMWRDIRQKIVLHHFYHSSSSIRHSISFCLFQTGGSSDSTSCVIPGSLSFFILSPSSLIFVSHFSKRYVGFCGDTGLDTQSFMPDVRHFSLPLCTVGAVMVVMGENMLDGGRSSGCKRSSNDAAISLVGRYPSRNTTLRVMQGMNRRTGLTGLYRETNCP